MNQSAQRQIKSLEILEKINAINELCDGLCKLAAEVETKILGSSSPWDALKEGKAEPAGFLEREIHSLVPINHSLRHIEQILNSISREF